MPNKEYKVSQLASKVSENTQYLHGEGSLENVIKNMAQSFVGSNNFPLLEGVGNFGTRFVPAAGAGRYIYTKLNPLIGYIFRKDDENVLIKQSFEGAEIEPQFYVPIIPLIFLNYSEGIGNGFAQKILPRNILELIESVETYLNKDKISIPFPNVEGFEGEIFRNTENELNRDQIVIKGVAEGDLKKQTVSISELPINTSLDDYTNFLKGLLEKKIIKSYSDLSENDKFHFEIKLHPNTEIDDCLVDTLKLQLRVSENFTIIDENNCPVEKNNANDIFKIYLNVRKTFYEKRIQFIINELKI